MLKKLLVLALPFFCFKAYAAQSSIDCVKDLQFSSSYLLKNDAGAVSIEKQSVAAATIDNYLEPAGEATTIRECEKVLRKYLKSIRLGHLWISKKQSQLIDKVAQQVKPERMPKIRYLSDDTLLLSLFSFHQQYKQPIIALLEKNQTEMQKRKYWIIDVRNNNGGDDSSYFPIIPTFMSNDAISHSVEYWITEDNFQAIKKNCTDKLPTTLNCKHRIALYNKSTENSFAHYGTEKFWVFPIAAEAKKHPAITRPEKIVMLSGKNCGSACEQFLLTARQGFNVTLIGQPTYGALDVSNMIWVDLPSRNFRLHYTLTRSSRLPQYPVDGIGVLPDIYFPDTLKEDWIEMTQSWLETNYWPAS